jgi:hypothetical protein
VTGRASQWRIPSGLLGIALTCLIALTVIDAHATPPNGGCFGSQTWIMWADFVLTAVSVLAASGSAVTFGWRLRWSRLACAVYAPAIAVIWLVVLLIVTTAAEGPC